MDHAILCYRYSYSYSFSIRYPVPPLLALYAIYYYTLIVANNAGSYLLVDYSAIV